jgi:hypothetical protein
LDSILGLDEQSRYWIGFTAATGRSVSATDILRWTENPCTDPLDLPVSVGSLELHEENGLTIRRLERDVWTIELVASAYDRAITVHDIHGAKIEDVSVAQGVDTIQWSSDRLPSGTYILQDVQNGLSALIIVVR